MSPAAGASPMAASPSASSVTVADGYVDAGNGVRLFYRVLDTPRHGRDTVVVLHGGPGLNLNYIEPDLHALAAGHTLIFYDQRGAGHSTVISDSAKLTVADHIADLDAVRRRFGLDRMTLLGHSWGVGLAARYALAHPDRVARMILVDGVPIRRDPYVEQFGSSLRAWMDSTTREQVAALSRARRTATDRRAACRAYWTVFIRGYLADPMDTAAVKRLHGDSCDVPPEADRNSPLVNSATMGALGAWDWRGDFAGLRLPVLIVHGARDPIPLQSAREWNAAIPGSRLVVLERSGHFSFAEQPAEFQAAVEGFLRQTEGR